jgi:hypothetical protein
MEIQVQLHQIITLVHAGGSGIVIARAPSSAGILFTTCSVCAPVTSPDGSTMIAEFKVSSNLNILDSGCGVAFDYLVVAGGGGGGSNYAGGGGAGGYRTSFPGGTKLQLQPGPIAVTIGGSGAGGTSCARGSSGTGSSVGHIFTDGGGGGGNATGGIQDGLDGGSGGGVANDGNPFPAPSGNVRTTDPVQGFNGGRGRVNPSYNGAGGGGGATAVGGNGGCGSTSQGPGGAGATNSITGSCVAYAGGGGGGGQAGSPTFAGAPGGTGGGGAGGGAVSGPSPTGTGTNGTANTGGGGGGGSCGPNTGGNGGTGIVILRVPAACAPGSLAAAPGTNTITTLPAPEGGCKIATFTVTGTLTV